MLDLLAETWLCDVDDERAAVFSVPPPLCEELCELEVDKLDVLSVPPAPDNDVVELISPIELVDDVAPSSELELGDVLLVLVEKVLDVDAIPSIGFSDVLLLATNDISSYLKTSEMLSHT